MRDPSTRQAHALTPAEIIKLVLRIKGWNQAELARATGITPANIWLYVSGRVIPRPRQLERILAQVQIPLAVAHSIAAWDRLLAESQTNREKAALALPADRLTQGKTQLAVGGVVERSSNFVRLELSLLRERPASLWNRLSRFEPARRISIVRDDPSFWRPGFCLWLCEESARKAADDAEQARDSAELALVVARQLRQHEPANERFFIRLEGWCDAFLANALRVAGDHDLAEAAFGLTRTLWKEGADEAGLLSEARILDLEASLRRDQRRFEAALRLHVQALEWANRAEEGAILLNQAGTFELKGQYARALAALDRAAPSIDGKRQPHLRWALRQNQALSLVRLCRAEEAQPAVAEALHLAQVLGNNLDLLRTRGLAALVDAGLGKRKEAVESLEQVCRTFAEKGYVYDYALVGLDLALLYRGENLWAEIRELAGRMVEIFRERNIHRETIAALLLFREAAAKEAVNVELVRRLQDYLQQAQARPGVRFR